MRFVPLHGVLAMAPYYFNRLKSLNYSIDTQGCIAQQLTQILRSVIGRVVVQASLNVCQGPC